MTTAQPFVLGDCLVEPDKHLLSGKGESVSVQPRLMHVLVRLAQAPGEPISRRDLIEAAWPEAPYVSDESLTKAVSMLRSALRSCTKESGLIRTIPKMGYMLTVQPVKDKSVLAEMRLKDRGPLGSIHQLLRVRTRVPAVGVRWAFSLVICLLAYWFGARGQTYRPAGEQTAGYSIRASTPDSLDWRTLLSAVPVDSQVISDSTWIEDGYPKVIRRRIALAGNEQLSAISLD